MRTSKRIRSLVGVGMAVSALLGCAVSAHAVDNIPNCQPLPAPLGAICNSNCQLGTDVVCQPGQQIVLNNGADLDMRLYSVSCAAGQHCGTAAVKINGSSSIVKSNVSGAQPKILGSWNSAVSCGGQSGSRVSGIRIEGHFTGPAVSNCAKVDGNVLIGETGSFRAIATSGVADSDIIVDNYVDGFWEDRIVWLSGTTHDIAVSHNTFVTRVVPGTQGYPIVVSANVPATITDNIFMGDSSQVLIATLAPSLAAFSGNICDPTLATCADAIANGKCAAPTAPYTTP